MYLTLKYLHALTVVVSLSLFLWRGALVFSARPSARWLKIAPHVNDTLLLSAAIAMLIVAGINPLDHPWLSGKILLLLAYIGLGSVALKRANLTAFLAALACFGAIVYLAVSKPAWPI
jgi:uncharacterized membrane protein SirB2